MRPAWTGGVTRGRLLLSRTIGRAQARSVAQSGSLSGGIRAIAASGYGERVRAGQDLAAAERAVAETLLWHLRIFAGWLPPAGVRLVRAICGWFELANIEARIAALAGDGREPEPFVLGSLATAWPAIDRARTLEELPAALAGSSWGRPPADSPAEMTLALRVAWARRAHEAAPAISGWIAGAGALLVARELLSAGDRAHVGQLGRLPGIADDALTAGTVAELASALAPEAAWPLRDLVDPADLWRGELEWWRVVEREARALLRGRNDRTVAAAVTALLAADAHRAAIALRAAAGGGGVELGELVDAAL